MSQNFAVISSSAWDDLAIETRTRICLLFSEEAKSAAKNCLIRRLTRVATWHRESKLQSDIATFTMRRASGVPPGIIRMHVDGWKHSLSAFVKDVAEFDRTMGLSRPTPLVSKIHFDLSEPHWHGRTVLRVRLSDGTEWYYKPRTGRHERAWAEIVSAFNRITSLPPLLAASVISKRKHCWTSAVTWKACRTRAETKRFYLRAGALLYLAHHLRAVDLHAENFVAHGEYPVLIDAETFLHPVISVPATAPDQPDSLIRTGMLPARKRDEICFFGCATKGKSRVVLKGRITPAAEMVDHIVAGFEEAHKVLCSGYSSLRNAIGRMRSLPIRIIYRPTHFYLGLLRESFSAGIAESESARRWLMRMRLEDGQCRRKVVRREIQQLMGGDVPLFYDRAASPRRFLSPAQLASAVIAIRASYR